MLRDDLLERPVGRLHLQRYADARIALAEGRDNILSDEGDEAGNGRDTNLRGPIVANPARDVADMLEPQIDSFDLLLKQLRLRCGRHAPPTPVEQHKPQFCFQFAYGPADQRLRSPQRLGGLGAAPRHHDRVEDLNLP